MAEEKEIDFENAAMAIIEFATDRLKQIGCDDFMIAAHINGRGYYSGQTTRHFENKILSKLLSRQFRSGHAFEIKLPNDLSEKLFETLVTQSKNPKPEKDDDE